MWLSNQPCSARLSLHDVSFPLCRAVAFTGEPSEAVHYALHYLGPLVQVCVSVSVSMGVWVCVGASMGVRVCMGMSVHVRVCVSACEGVCECGYEGECGYKGVCEWV